MTAALAREPAAQDLLAGYLGHALRMGLSGRAMRDRERIARDFLTRHPDPEAWMSTPAASRVTELKRTGAWPLVCFAIGSGRLLLDVDLAGIKHLTGLGRAVEDRDPAGFALARAAGLQLGWTQAWVETILGECLAVLLAWHGGPAAGLTAEAVDAFDTELGSSMTMPRSAVRAYRRRLASLRQILFETKVTEAPPRRGPRARTLEERFADVPVAPAISRVLLRYVQARSAVLRPKSVESLVNDLLPFADYLAAHHSALTSLQQLERSHIEGYLTWHRTRPWRGRRAAAGAGRPISAAVAQAAVLSLRNMLDDIAAWGWAEAPARRLVFAADVPRLDQPLPRALPPDIDQALMMPSPAWTMTSPASCSQCCGARACGSASCWTSKSAASLTTARPEPGCVSRLASSPPSAWSRSTPPRSPSWTNGPASAAVTGRCRIPAPGRSPTSCSPPTAAASAQPGSVTDC